MDTTRKVGIKIANENKFKTFSETYKLCAFALAIAYIYPNKATARKRLKMLLITIALNIIELYWYMCYLIVCIIRMDIYNFTRQITIGIIISLYLFKAFYGIFVTEKFEHILQEITDDLLRGNELSMDLQEIYFIYIKRAKIAQACWTVIPLLLGTQFTIYSAVCMIYEYMTTDLWNRYMVHEMELQHIQHLQYRTPYFETIFAYNCIQSLILAPNYSGFDGSFCIATTHMCLKLKIVGYSVQKAFKDINDRKDLRKKMKSLIEEHQKALLFHRKMQNVYGEWLFMVFLLTSILISFNVYQIYCIGRIDPKYTIFTLSAVLHMFLPCYYASDLIQANDEFQRDIYNARWETTGDPVVSRYLTFMIARSQQRLILTGKGIVTFDMQLFVTILHTSYSFFTLISTK
ncbi:putative odorant receptor 92a [Plodia interpunctella]|uniref:putative odorant receptor 92a n=1 Tax=Plodia interpunctella TaxID=58824 RepID=UPI00236741FF|nr:putative odorant receptor 92a [Plodia interpunctella]